MYKIVFGIPIFWKTRQNEGVSLIENKTIDPDSDAIPLCDFTLEYNKRNG